MGVKESSFRDKAIERICQKGEKRCSTIVNGSIAPTINAMGQQNIWFENEKGDKYALTCSRSDAKYTCELKWTAASLFSGGDGSIWGCGAGSDLSDTVHVGDVIDIFDVNLKDVDSILPLSDAPQTDTPKDVKIVPQTDTGPQKKERIIAATSDYSKGSVYLFDEGFPLSAAKILDETSVGSDICLRGFEDTLAVIDRFGGDKIQLFTANGGFSLMNSFFTGSGSNPQDALLFSGGTLYASVYSTKDGNGGPIMLNGQPIGDVLVFDVPTGGLTTNISLDQYSTNGQPNAATMVSANGDIYAIMQDLDGFTPNTNGKLAVISGATNKTTDVIDLACYNPYDMAYSPDMELIFIACAGDFMVTDETNAGIEIVDVANKKSLGLLLTEESIGNNATRVRIVSEDMGVIATSNFNDTDISFVTLFNPVTGTITDDRFYGTEMTNISDILIDSSHMLWIADRDATQSGVVCVDPNNGEPLGDILTLESPPASLAAIELAE